MSTFSRRPEGQVFPLFGKPYRWNGSKLERVPDEQARCSAELERNDRVLRCYLLDRHDGNHAAR